MESEEIKMIYFSLLILVLCERQLLLGLCNAVKLYWQKVILLNENILKTHHVLLTIIIVVLINNALLLGYLSKDSEPVVMVSGDTSKQVTRTDPVADHRVVSDRYSDQDSDLDNHTEQLLNSELEAKISEAVDQYLLSGNFTRQLNNYQKEFASEFEEIHNRLTVMSVTELYSVSIDSSNPSEQEYAQQLLAQNGFGELDATQLKSLYLTDDVSSWGEESLLLKLLEGNDAEAIGWVKQKIADGSMAQYQNPEIFSAIFDADPDFVKQHVRDLDLNNPRQSVAALSFIMRDSELSKNFYEQNFDKLLDVKNSQIYQYLYPPAELELSSGQQNRLVELFDSQSRQRREFAISQARNIGDVNVLRDAYSRLSKNSEKLSFLQNLSNGENKTDVALLIQELVAESNDANIREMITW